MPSSARLPSYSSLVAPLVANFGNENSSIIFATESKGGFGWLLGDPSLEEIHKMNQRGSFDPQIIPEISTGVFWNACDEIIPLLSHDEELQISAVGVDQDGAFDLMEFGATRRLRPRSLGASGPFAVSLPALSRRSARTTRATHGAITRALCTAMDKEGHLVQHILLGIRIQRARGKPQEESPRRHTRAIAPATGSRGGQHFVEVVAEVPEFRALLIADRHGHAGPIEEIVAETEAISAIITHKTHRERAATLSPFPLLLRFSMSAPACFKTMIVTTISNPKEIALIASDKQRENVQNLHAAIIRFAKALSTLPRLKSSSQRDDGRPRARARRRSQPGPHPDTRARAASDRAPPEQSATVLEGVEERNASLKARYTQLSQKITQTKKEISALQRQQRTLSTDAAADSLEHLRGQIHAQEERIIAAEKALSPAQTTVELHESALRVLKMIRAAMHLTQAPAMPSTLARRLEKLSEMGDGIERGTSLPQLVAFFETVGFGVASAAPARTAPENYRAE
eukprot:gnl/Chilomastix_cuspidata/4806.p1 GENE.gnl/Chilomastix_cuspidata/4806~~gnl/Chilomastix_cuspidata/4806.p1  ORF type:complete len:515 (-),score=135.90 gnl/Chilomastix_cuspidata/4806:43-1587(-)